MSQQKYFAKAIDTLRHLAEAEQKNIAAAADLMVEAITGDRSIFAFGASHSFIIVEEMVYRAGGLMLANPILPHGANLMMHPVTATSRMERVLGLGKELLNTVPLRANDVLLIASVSGRNPIVVDMALAARERKAKLIGLTSFDYSGNVTSRHPSGKKLMDLCDVVIDNHAPYGDGAVPIEGFPQKVGPLSSVTGCAIVNAIVCEVADKLVKRGIEPPIFVSGNRDDGDAYNTRLMEKNRHRIHYL